MNESIDLTHLKNRVTGKNKLPPAAAPTVATANEFVALPVPPGMPMMGDIPQTGYIPSVESQATKIPDRVRAVAKPDKTDEELLEEIKKKNRNLSAPKEVQFSALPKEQQQQLRQAVPALAEEDAEVVDDLDTPPEKPEPKSVETKVPEETASSLPPVEECPHCHWNLNQRDIPDPTYGEKLAFVASIGGMIPFTKNYSILNGQFNITFRTLRPKEFDACWSQVFYLLSKGKIAQVDIQDYVTRFRTYLQIVRIESKVPEASFIKNFPEGFTKETAPQVETHWQVEGEDSADNGLSLVAEFMQEKYMSTESLHRIIVTQAQQFNRLVAKLEAVVDDSDFWKPTEGQS